MTPTDISRLATNRHYRKQNEFYRHSYEDKCIPWHDKGTPSPSLVKAVRRLQRKADLKKALDLGSGQGRHTLYLRTLGMKVVGIEYQQEALERSAGRGKRGILYLRGDIFRMPLKPGRFDLLVDYGVFHHIRRKHTALYVDLLARLLVPKGHLLLSVFGRDFTHKDGKKYTRGFLVHKNHYDRFCTTEEIRASFGKRFDVRQISKDREGFLHATLRLKQTL